MRNYKHCKTCKLLKPTRSFIMRTGNESKLCKPCRRAKGRADCQRYRDKRAETVKRWIAAHPEKWKAICQKSRDKREKRKRAALGNCE